jgi:hypothetical protein
VNQPTIKEKLMKTNKYIFWIKERIHWILCGGKCWRCGGKLHLNAMGFYNCGKCFHEFMLKELGETDSTDY